MLCLFASGATRDPNNKPTIEKTNRKKTMKETLTTLEVADRLFRDENASWTYSGARALAEYLEEYEESTGEEMELDIVAIRCDFAQWASLQEWAHDYFSNALEEMGFDDGEEIDDEEFDEKIREYIQDHGELIEFDGGIIVSSF